MKENIIEALKDVHKALEPIEISNLLNYKTTEEYSELCDALDSLVKENKIYKTKKDKYILFENCPGIKCGKLAINKKGFGFLILDKEDDLYVDAHNLNGAIDGDIVICEVIIRGVKKEGRVIKILKRDLKNVVGEIVIVDNKKAFKNDDVKKDIEVILTEDSTYNCVEGHKVLVKIIKELSKRKYLGQVITILGHKDDPKIDILSIAYKHEIYDKYIDEVLKELENIPEEVTSNDLLDRVDLTNKTIFTIDGKDTKDIDDAISIEKKGNNYVLGVHIADVSHYVKENTALGDDAYNRATSSYLADTVIPMLPHKLSNGICSLNEGVLRLTMSCVMEFDITGKLITYDIFRSYIKSDKKMNYDDVNTILHHKPTPDGYQKYVNDLLLMNELAHILRKKKNERGYINFGTSEAKIIQDETGKAIDIVKRQQDEGEKLIEDFMVAANECVAMHIYNMGLPFIYRVHDKPSPDKIDEFVTLVHLMGYKLRTNTKEITPKTMQLMLEELEDKPEYPILSTLLLRSMKKAIYSKENIGHFGLASNMYTHFTSPIRRFPDLTVHRLLKKYLFEKDMSMTTIASLESSLVEIAEHCSEKEQASVEAERDVDDMKMAEYMEDKIGQEYDGFINTITNFGMFVQLDNLIEGLVHVKSLKGDYFTYVPELLSMVGKSTKKTYRLGDKVRVRCIAASKINSQIDFEIVEDLNDRNPK